MKDQSKRPFLVKGIVTAAVILGAAVPVYQEYRTDQFYKKIYLDSVKRVEHAKKCCTIRVLGTDDERG